MYISMFLIILIFAFISFSNKKKYRRSFIFILGILFLMSGLRYGGNGDYFNYMHIYNAAPSFFEIDYLVRKEHVELGFKIIMNFSRIIGFSYTQFNFMIALFEFFCIKKFITKYSTNYFLSLLIFYSVLYGIYFCGATRQGIAMSIFVGFMVPLLLDRKYKKYLFLNLVVIGFHSSSIILIVLPIIIMLKFKFNIYTFVSLLCCSPVFLIIMNYISKNYETIYLDEISFSFFNTFILLLSVFLMIFFFKVNRRHWESIKLIEPLFYVYFYGVFLYVIFMFYATATQRLYAYFLTLLVVLIPISIENIKKGSVKDNAKRLKIIIYTLLNIYCISIFIKNQDMFIMWNKFENVNIFTYPYINVFNEEKFYEFVRDIPYSYRLLN